MEPAGPPRKLPPIPEVGATTPAPGLDGWEAVMFAEAASAPAPGLAPGVEAPGTEKTRGAGQRAKPRANPRIVVYPFESDFDEGALGAKMSVLLTGHAARTKRFEALPRITQDEILGEHPFKARHEGDVDRIARHARDAFDADVAVWGKVEGGRAKPVIGVKAVDLRGEKPVLVLAESYTCANIHLIPIYADEIVGSLLGRRIAAYTRARTVKALSGDLLTNGSFSKGLKGWTPNFPAHASVKRGRLVFDIPKDVAGGHGMEALSDYVPAEKGAHYELSLRVRSHGPSVITWVKGYAEFPARSAGEREIDPRREVFRHQMRPASQAEPGPGGWISVTTKPFRHRHPRFDATWMRVKLYAYWPAGKVEFDDVVLRKVQVEGETSDEEDERMRRAYEGKDPGETFEEGRGP